MEMYRIDAKYHHTEKDEYDEKYHVYVLKGTHDALAFYKNFVENVCYQKAYCTDIKEYIFNTKALVEDDIQIGCVINEQGKHCIYMLSEVECLRSDAEHWISSLPARIQPMAMKKIIPLIDEKEEDIKRKRKAC